MRPQARRLRGGRQGGGAGRQLRTPSRTLQELTTAGSGQRTPVALLAGEPAGTLAPRVAGAAEFKATISWRSPEDVPDEPALSEPPGPARCSIVESESPEAATRRLCGELRALSQADIGASLEVLLREVTTFATLTEATLEVRVARSVPPRVASPRALEMLARDLWEAGFPVRVAASWTPAPEAGAYLGVEGREDLFEFIRAHASWRPA